MTFRGCILVSEGFYSCDIAVNGKKPCDLGFSVSGNKVKRLVYDIVLSRPEDYLSIYQSMCNHVCLKCHSWHFSQIPEGKWYGPEDILREVLRYREQVTVWEPRSRATMWHASDLCAHCGLCYLSGEKGPFCPGKLRREQVVVSPQGYGPARNIVSFTGGDLYCRREYYVPVFKLLKKEVPDMWLHIETNGYGLTRRNLEAYWEAGLDSIWLDMKAFKEDVYKRLCGTSNKHILELPELIHDMGFVLEIVLLYIPGLVEVEQISLFGELLASVDKDLPVTLLAFFPEYKLLNHRSPSKQEMLHAYTVLKEKGLRKVKIGNIGVFCRTKEDIEDLIKSIGRQHVAL